jgi:peptide/nickel transport system permease protein
MQSSSYPPMLERLLHAVAVMVLSVLLAFAVLHLVPGDPLTLMVEQTGRTPAARALLRTRYGLDLSLVAQFSRFVSNLLRGDLGTSLSNGLPVARLVRDALGNSLLLGATSLVAATGTGLVVGSAEGWWPRSRAARAAGAALTALYAVPEFVFASLAIAVLAYGTGWFPVGGVADPMLQFGGTPAELVVDRLRHLVLPTMTLALGWGAGIARQQRRALDDIARESFVRTARAKGLSELSMLWRHGLRPSIPTVAATLGLLLPALVGGAVVVELVFSWPGIGSLMVQSIAARDYPVVTGAMLVVGGAVACAVLATDFTRWCVDPRLRESNA